MNMDSFLRSRTLNLPCTL